MICHAMGLTQLYELGVSRDNNHSSSQPITATGHLNRSAPAFPLKGVMTKPHAMLRRS